MACPNQYEQRRQYAMFRMALRQVAEKARESSEHEMERRAASQEPESDPKAPKQ